MDYPSEPERQRAEARYDIGYNDVIGRWELWRHLTIAIQMDGRDQPVPGRRYLGDFDTERDTRTAREACASVELLEYTRSLERQQGV